MIITKTSIRGIITNYSISINYSGELVKKEISLYGGKDNKRVAEISYVDNLPEDQYGMTMSTQGRVYVKKRYNDGYENLVDMLRNEAVIEIDFDLTNRSFEIFSGQEATGK